MPGPRHGQTRDFLSALSQLHPRVREFVMQATYPWFAAMPVAPSEGASAAPGPSPAPTS